MTHRDPVQRSARVLTCRPMALPVWTTAWQPHALPHATPASWLESTAGLGVFTMDQADPFQCSIRACTGGGRVVGCRVTRVELPTAVQSEALVQEMPVRSALVCAVSGGPASVDHRVPFQRSVSA